MLQEKGLVIADAANAAVYRQSRETQGTMRTQISQRLSERAANAMRLRFDVFPNRIPGSEGEVVGLVHSAWWRRSKRTGEPIDLFAAFERGDIIRPVNGPWLVMPLPAAYDVVGIPRGARGRVQRPTPTLVEAALDTDLFVIKRPGRPSLLAANAPVRYSRGGKPRVIATRYRTKKGRLASRRGPTVMVPLFLLLKNARLPKRLDFSGIEAAKARGLSDKFLVEFAARDRR